MKGSDERELRRRLRDQYALVTRSDLRLLGVTAKVERRRVASGEWERRGPNVIAVSAAPRSSEQALLAACLAAGPDAVASHQSAAWMWHLAGLPDRHSVSARRGTRPNVAGGVEVHHLVDMTIHAVDVRHIPCTNPLRTLVDFAAVAGDSQLDDALDRALATRLVTVQGIEAEMARLGRQGRAGVGRMRATLKRRGFDGVLQPSVLESRFLRLLRLGGIEPLAVEVKVGENGRYRLDTLIAPDLAVEVDGYGYHSSPEQVTEDERRRRRIRASGIELLVYTYREVVFDPRRVLREIAVARYAHGRLAER